MTAREFLEFALDEFDFDAALTALAQYVGKPGSYFMSFPDAEVTDQDGNPLEENLDEPANFQEFYEGRA